MYKITGFADEINEDFLTQLTSFKELGINYIEIRGINGVNISKLEHDKIIDIKNKLESFNIQVSSIASPIGKIFITEDFEPHFLVFKKIVETAKILNTKYIRIFSFFIPEGLKSSSFKDEVIRRLKLLVEYAKENNVILLHENEKFIYGDTPENCLNLFNEILSPNFGLIFDFANFVHVGVNPLDAYRVLKNHIKYYHIKDSKQNGQIVPAGMGDGHIETILKQVLECGFSGFISLEPHLSAFKGLEELELNKKIDNYDNNGFDNFKIAKDSLDIILEKINGGNING